MTSRSDYGTSCPWPSIMDARGRITDTGTQFDGMDRLRLPRCRGARKPWPRRNRIVEEKRPYPHSVGHSERSGEPIEPRLVAAVVGSEWNRWPRRQATRCATATR